jgi:two-component system, OmpR family, sensor kinase
VTLPIRLRLTLAFALSMTVLLAAAGAFLYVRLGAELRAATDASLVAQADVLASSAGQQRVTFGDTTTEAVNQGQPFAQVIDLRGRILESSDVVASAPLLPLAELRGVTGPSFFEREVRGVEGMARLYVVPVVDEGRHELVVVGASLNNRREILSRFLLLLTVGGPVALLMASGVAWLIAGAAFRPVERMRREASSISVSDRGRRLPVPPTGDEIARLGATLNVMLDGLQHAFDRERRFVDDASHELRTPLTILRAELDLALSRARSPEQIDAALRSAIEEADRLSDLADDLLVYSRVDGAHVPLRREPVRLDRVIADVCGSFAAGAADRGVRIEMDAPAATADLDEARFRQALRNVVDNALRHTPAGGRIRVRAACAPDEVRVSVDDSGSGFDPGLAAFEPFARGSTERANAAPGAGLGLAIVRAVAEAHGGRAIAENRTGGGASVTMVLPL